MGQAMYASLATTIENAGRNQLDDCSRHVSAALGVDSLTDDQATRLYELIQVRRGAGRCLAASTPAIVPRYYIQRSPDQRSPDRRASLLRRRTLAATNPLPPYLAAQFTTGELAVLKIVGDECLAHGVCDLSHNEMAARAGTCRSLAKRTMRLIERDGLITVQRRPRSGRKHLTNIIRIIRAEWLDWLRKGSRRAYAIKVCNRAKPDFPPARGVQESRPRAQHFKNRTADRVDKAGEKGIRTGAGRAGP
jgi:hypothetical protein